MIFSWLGNLKTKCCHWYKNARTPSTNLCNHQTVIQLEDLAGADGKRDLYRGAVLSELWSSFFGNWYANLRLVGSCSRFMHVCLRLAQQFCRPVFVLQVSEYVISPFTSLCIDTSHNIHMLHMLVYCISKLTVPTLVSLPAFHSRVVCAHKTQIYIVFTIAGTHEQILNIVYSQQIYASRISSSQVHCTILRSSFSCDLFLSLAGRLSSTVGFNVCLAHWRCDGQILLCENHLTRFGTCFGLWITMASFCRCSPSHG